MNLRLRRPGLPFRPGRFPVVAGTICAALFVSLLIVAGCKKKAPPVPAPAQVHAVTRQMLRAANGIVREPRRLESKMQFDASEGRADRIRITLPGPASPQPQAQLVSQLVQSLDRIATANALTRDASKGAAPDTRLQYRRNSVVTHIVEIIAAPASAKPEPTARLAIILDDFGNDHATAESVFSLGYPLTISVLPNHPHSAQIAEEAHRRGLCVMLHLPMQSVANEQSEPQELRPGMAEKEVTSLVDQWLAAVPHVAGVNNHQGSQSTADAALMGELMPVLRERHLFYIDSRTTPATVAYDTAQHHAVRSGFRNVPFLDDVVEVNAVRKQLRLAFRDAQKKGDAIAIGHPHPATLTALRELLPQAQADGVELVPASALVH